MRSLLAHPSLSQLARDYDEALRRAEASSQIVKKPPLAALPTPGTTSSPPNTSDETASPATEQHISRSADNSQVFGVVSPNFGGTGSRSTTPAPSPASVTPAALIDTRYQHVHTLTLQLIRAWQDYEVQGGDWTRPYVRQDLLQVRTIVEAYLRRANALLPEDQKRPDVPRKETE